MKHKKPLDGSHVRWLGLVEPRNPNAMPFWDCPCGARRFGLLIKECDECGLYPPWEYTIAYPFVLFDYIKMEIKGRLRHFLLAIANKL